MATATESKRSTKELILDAAFSFCNEPRYKLFSLNELAAKVGITKPAIYRHFKDKDAVYAAMRERFATLLAECLRKVQAADGGVLSIESVVEIICFFSEHPGYINYLLENLANEAGFELRMAQELERRGVRNLSGFQYDTNGGTATIKDFAAYVRCIYCGITIHLFIRLREKILRQGAAVIDTATFATKLVRLLGTGLDGLPQGVLTPVALTDARRAELDALCAIDSDVLPSENRIFNAFATVVKKYTWGGVTIERIAAELSMAKSSLYEYFDNKNEMIRTLIAKELTLLSVIINENVVEARNFSEYLYVLMRTELSFFQQRISIIPMCAWLLMDNSALPLYEAHDFSNEWEQRLSKPLAQLDLGMEVHPREFICWVSALPVVLVMQCTQHCSLVGDDMNRALQAMFGFLQYGIDSLH